MDIAPLLLQTIHLQSSRPYDDQYVRTTHREVKQGLSLRHKNHDFFSIFLSGSERSKIRCPVSLQAHGSTDADYFCQFSPVDQDLLHPFFPATTSVQTFRKRH